MKPSRTEFGRLARGLSCVLMLATPNAAIAQGVEFSDRSSDAEAAPFLLIPLGARNIGFGGAIAGARGDVEGVLWNPASIAAIDEWAVFYHGSNDFGTSTNAAGGVFRLGTTRVGVSILALDLGTIDGRDEFNQPIGNIEIDNTAFVLTVARAISESIEVGASYKLLRISGSCPGCGGDEPDATGYAFDAAVIARPPGTDRIRLGLIVSNLGPDLGFSADGQENALPSRIRLGGEAELLRGSEARPVDLLVRADVRNVLTELDGLDVFAGIEVGYADLAFLRAGYASGGEGRTGPTLGVGFRYNGLVVDLGRTFDDFSDFDSDSPFQVSVAYQP